MSTASDLASFHKLIDKQYRLTRARGLTDQQTIATLGFYMMNSAVHYITDPDVLKAFIAALMEIESSLRAAAAGQQFESENGPPPEKRG